MGVEKRQILLADDSLTILKVVSNILEQQGYQVITATDGVEAASKAFAENPDLILLDVMMPKMNGYQVCRLLKNVPKTANIPIVILTSKDQPREKFWGYQTGANKYVTKGSDLSPLLAAVDELLSEKKEPFTSEAGQELVIADAEFDILARSNDLLDAKLFEATVLNEIGKLAANLRTFAETASAIFELLGKLVTFAAGVIAFSHGEEGRMLVKVNPGVNKEYLREYRRYLEAEIKENHPESIPPAGYTWEILDRGKTGVIPEQSGGNFDPKRVLTFFLFSKGKVVGLLSVTATSKHKFTRVDRETLQLFVTYGTVVLENAWLYETVRKLSIMDGLTKVFNRRYIEERLQEEICLSARRRTPLALLILDVDHFKKVNDKYGHQAGDIVLKYLMETCQKTVRSTDLLGRYGGEEFLAILPDTAKSGALTVAERVRTVVQSTPIPTCAGRISITISLGLATVPDPNIWSGEDLIKAADLALYRAKNSGRNCVCVYDVDIDGKINEH